MDLKYFIAHFDLSNKLQNLENQRLIEETKKIKGLDSCADEEVIQQTLYSLVLKVEELETLLYTDKKLKRNY